VERRGVLVSDGDERYSCVPGYAGFEGAGAVDVGVRELWGCGELKGGRVGLRFFGAGEWRDWV
jgi:hypothetical protein